MSDDLFHPGPGLLDRIQKAKQTRRGATITSKVISPIWGNAEWKNKQWLAWLASHFTEEPFIQLGVITEHLCLTGVGGLNVDRIKQYFKAPIGCIMNVTFEMPLFTQPGVESYRVPVDDNDKDDLILFFDEVTAKFDEMAKAGKLAIVHCLAGISRSATFAMAYLIRYKNMTLAEAFLHLKSRRPIARSNFNFLRQLSQYETQVHGTARQTIWTTYTKNGVTRNVPEFLANSEYIRDFAFEFRRA